MPANYVNPNASFQTQGSSVFAPATTAGAAAISGIAGQPPAPISAGVLSTPTLPSLPQPQTSTVPAAPAIPSLNDIFNTPDTPLDDEEKTGAANEGALGAELAGQTVYQDQQEASAGIPGLKSTVNDLTNQLNNLKAAGDQIPLQEQNDAAGRGDTVGGVSSLQSAATRNNTIQQLGVSAMLNAANGNLSTAQDQVDAAVKAKFDPIQAQLDAQKAQLAAIQPLLDDEEKKQAAEQSAQLQERQDALTQQKTDMATGQAMATAALTNNPGSASALNAAQQVMGLDPSDPSYLSKVMGLVGQYQSDPNATALQLAQLQQARAQTAYVQAQTAALGDSSGALLAKNNLKTTSDGTQYIDGSSLTGKDEQSAQQAAAAAGIPYVSSADSAVLDNISAAQTNLASIQSIFDTRSIGNVYQTGLDAISLTGWKNSMISAIKGIAGPGSGVRGATLVQQMMDSLPSEADPKAVAATKISTLNKLLSTAQGSILGTLPSAGTTVMTGPDGTQYNVPISQVATFKANGYK